MQERFVQAMDQAAKELESELGTDGVPLAQVGLNGKVNSTPIVEADLRAHFAAAEDTDQ